MPDAVAAAADFKQGEETIAMEHHKVTVIFADIIGSSGCRSNCRPRNR